MSNYNPPIKNRDTEELIIIANSTKDDWQIEAINEAKNELRLRNINIENQKEFIDELANLSKQELRGRAKEDYSIFEKFILVIFWYKEVFRGWSLKKEGYVLKSKKRLKLISLGIILTIILFVFALISFESEEKRRLEEINKVDISEWERNRIPDNSNDTLE